MKLAQFLERLRAQFGKPVIINSGHRPYEVNLEWGGAPDSEHLFNAVGKGAVDVSVKDVNPLVVEEWILNNWQESVGKG